MNTVQERLARHASSVSIGVHPWFDTLVLLCIRAPLQAAASAVSLPLVVSR
jgi:hypothetical protein